MAVLQKLHSENEDLYVQTFLQFIVDCAELEVDVSEEISFRSVILQSESGSERFLAYRDPQLGKAIDDFLRVYLGEASAFESSRWSERVLELLTALIEAGDRFAVCGLYFGKDPVANIIHAALRESNLNLPVNIPAMRILINGMCQRECHRMEAVSSRMELFCSELFKLYDQELL